jgi:hypothetical protein
LKTEGKKNKKNIYIMVGSTRQPVVLNEVQLTTKKNHQKLYKKQRTLMV